MSRVGGAFQKTERTLRCCPQGHPFEAEFPGVGRKTLLLNARRLVTAENNPDWILLAMQDVTGRK